MLTKLCTKCERDLPLSGFGKKAGNRDGLQHRCRDCRSIEGGEFYKRHAERIREKNNTSYWSDPEKSRAYQAERRLRNPHVFKSYSAKSYAKNKEKRLAQMKRYQAANLKRATERAAAWKKKNKPALAEFERRRYAKKIRAIPAWANQDLIREIYVDAAEFRAFGIDVQVDHIVPLCSKIVCGLHVASNLRIAMTKHNQKKSNREWPDMPI